MHDHLLFRLEKRKGFTRYKAKHKLRREEVTINPLRGQIPQDSK